MCRELIIIDGKCYDIQNLGWNPKQCNPQLKKMCKGKDLRARHYYVKKNSNDRKGYTLEQLARKYELGTLEDKLWQIIEAEYETFVVEADWNEEFPKFKDGYNKANKWHYIKNGDLPKKNANADDWKLFLLVLLKHDDHGKNFFAWVLSYYDFHKKEWLIDYGMGEPYAWYELPERPKLPEEKTK